MTTPFVVDVTLMHKDTQRRSRTIVTVGVDGDDPVAATLIAAQLAVSHRDGWMPIRTLILAAEI